eukprot:GEMP01022166.1.p1 GENE.GEMP01022166.1~~GEMP01022166.1.p1  ORF type:complete len:288 (+),score=67.63 GEMP01022166.1:134-997(+)
MTIPHVYKLSRLKAQTDMVRQALSVCAVIEDETGKAFFEAEMKLRQKPDETEERQRWLVQAELRQLRQQCQSARDRIRKLSLNKREAEEMLESRKEQLLRSRRGLANVRLRLHDGRERALADSYCAIRSLDQRLRCRRTWMLHELSHMYPIENLGQYRTIRGFCIPLVETLNRKDPREEKDISCALGFLCHLLLMVAKYLDVPLRFTLVPGASKASLKEIVSSTGETKIWPLHYRGENNAFQTSIMLLLDQEIELLHGRGHLRDWKYSRTNLLENAERLLKQEMHGV